MGQNLEGKGTEIVPKSVYNALLAIDDVNLGNELNDGTRKVYYRDIGQVGYIDSKGNFVLETPKVVRAFGELRRRLDQANIEYKVS